MQRCRARALVDSVIHRDDGGRPRSTRENAVPSGLRFIAMLLLLTGLQAWPVAAQPVDPVAVLIRQQLQPPFDVPATGLVQARAQFYALGDFAPAWTRAADVDQLLAALRGMTADGLDPADYGLDELLRQRAALADPRATPMQRARFDLLATDACLTALADLYRGKVDPASLDTHWNFDPRLPAPGQGVQTVRDALAQGQLTPLFARARPQSPLYDQLRASLVRWRDLAAQGGWAPIPGGPALKPGMRDARVPALRQRLRVTGYLPATVDGAVDAGPSEDYDAATGQALRQFQSEQYLTVDGQLGPATLAALNVPAAARIDQLRVNLERARWLLHQLHGDFVMVDIAGYRIAYYRDGKPVWRSRVQVGKPYRSTPAFKSQITYLTLNPTWTVPPTILKNDVLPKVRRNRGYLAANHLRVLDAQGRERSPASVDWSNPRGIVLRQDAGPHNSLGRLAIRFPNDYSVYLHDTPHQELFAHPQRANSSGCIRVERPRELAELLLDDPARWNRAAIDRAIDTGKTQEVVLARPVTLLLAYWTVDLHENGRIGFRPDIYRRDAPLLAALNRPRAWP
jgi:murein L,D-transpeptidase YcbB/YkuD